MPERDLNPFPYTQLLRVEEPWLAHVLANACFVYRQHLEREINATRDETTRFALRLALCETGAAQEQLLAITVDEIERT